MRVSTLRFLNLAFPMALLLACGSLSSVHASTVLQMSFGEVVGKSELVFEGSVTGLEARRSADGGIHTFVTFQISEVVKGAFPSDTIELRFLGGQIGSKGLQVSDMQMPVLGETGFYFVESLRDFQVNPLVGWAQGHYLIEELSNGDTVVTTVNHERIDSLEAASSAAVTLPQTISKGVANGVTVRRGLASNASFGVSAAQFKASVRDIAEPPQ